MENALFALAGSAITATIGLILWRIRARYESRLRNEEARVASLLREREIARAQQRQIYMDVLTPFIAMLRSTKSRNPEQESAKALREIRKVSYWQSVYALMFMGSDEVVNALNNMMQFAYRAEGTNSRYTPEVLIELWGGLLLAVRRDLFVGETELEELDMLRAYITDIDAIASEDEDESLRQ